MAEPKQTQGIWTSLGRSAFPLALVVSGLLIFSSTLESDWFNSKLQRPLNFAGWFLGAIATLQYLTSRIEVSENRQISYMKDMKESLTKSMQDMKEDLTKRIEDGEKRQKDNINSLKTDLIKRIEDGEKRQKESIDELRIRNDKTDEKVQRVLIATAENKTSLDLVLKMLEPKVKITKGL